MKKITYLLALLFTASTLFISCNDDDNANITVADRDTLNQTVYADQNRGENTVRFTTTAAWISSIAETRNTANWVSITPSSGNAGTHNITLNLQPNETGEDRSAIITITSDNASIEIRITQQGINAPIAVTGVTLAGCNPDTPLAVGNTRQLTATIAPANATNTAVTWSSSNNNIATVENGLVTAVTAGTATITVTTADGGKTDTCVITIVVIPGIGAPTATTDPGVVINGVRWATRNVNTPGTFAAYPHSAGRIFQWGTLNGVTHHFDSTTPGAIDGWYPTYNTAPKRVAWTSATDPCPLGWRVPTHAELTALRGAGVGDWTELSGVNGRFFGTATNRIFLPAAGGRHNLTGELTNVGTSGNYWSNTLIYLIIYDTYATHAHCLRFGSRGFHLDRASRSTGLFVRCVAE